MRIPIDGGHFFPGQGALSVVYSLYTSEGQRSPGKKWPRPEGLDLVCAQPALRSAHLEQPNHALRALSGHKRGPTLGIRIVLAGPRVQGDFVWHDHADTDETFIVLEGSLRIEFRDGHVDLEAGEMYVVPRGVEHRPRAENEVKLLLIEPRGVVNTGETGGELTAARDVWI